MDWDLDSSLDDESIVWGIVEDNEKEDDESNLSLFDDKPLLVKDVLIGDHVSLDGELISDGLISDGPVHQSKRKYATQSCHTGNKPCDHNIPRDTSKHKSVYDWLPDQLKFMFANHRTLHQDDVYNMIFIFEEPTKEYRQANKSFQLTQLGCYHPQQIKLAAMIHVIFPGESQFYLLQHGEGAHHQDQWSNFSRYITLLKKYGMLLCIYSPTRSHWGEFIMLLNGPDAEFAKFIRWDALRNLCLAKTATSKQADDQQHKSGTSRDYGFCRSQNSSADGSSTGIPAPRLKADSTNLAMQEAMVAITEAALQVDPTIFDRVDPRAFDKFSFKIHPKNRLTLARESETKLGLCCGIHDNQLTNSWVMTAVLGASVIRNGVRHSFNPQHKHSVDAYCHQVEKSSDLMSRIQDFVQQCDSQRNGVSQDLFKGETVKFIRSVPCIVNQANLDPKSFGQTNLDSALQLCLEFLLSLQEIVSLLLGMEMVPNQTYLSRVAALIMLQSPALEKHLFPRGPLFGHLFALNFVK